MTGEDLVPFSARIRGARAQVDNDFPSSARVGLLHLLHEVVRKKYVEGWQDLAMELDRVARVQPEFYGTSYPGDQQVKAQVEAIMDQLPWEKVYDFCERL